MIRSYQPGDHAAIAVIFSRAIHEIACEVYTPEQCSAWADRMPNPSHWEKRCAVKRPFVFVLDGTIAGFLELDADGHIDCTYVHPEYRQRGIASRLIEHAVGLCARAGLPRVYVEASLCARPVFEKQGFRVLEARSVEVRGEKLINFAMELPLNGDEQGTPGNARGSRS